MNKLTLRGVIGDEITAGQVEESLAEADGAALHLVLSTPGGSVDEGFDIYNQLRDYPGELTVEVTSIAASMGSVILLAADRRIGRPTARVMVHDPWTIALGNARGFREVAEVLDMLGDQMAALYGEKTNESAEYWRGVMAKDTYFDHAEALEVGLFTEVRESANEAPASGKTVAPVVSLESPGAISARVAALRLRQRIIDNGNARP